MKKVKKSIGYKIVCEHQGCGGLSVLGKDRNWKTANRIDAAIKRAVREAFVHGQWSGYYKRTPPKNKPSICVRDHLDGLLFVETKYGVKL